MALPSTPRLPHNYRLLLELIDAGGAGTHRSTSEIYQLMKSSRPAVGYSTVQRGLRRLAELGLILPVHLPGQDATLYEAAGGLHAHFSCTRCRRTTDVEYVLPAQAVRQLADDLGIEVHGESVSLHGLCRDCRA